MAGLLIYRMTLFLCLLSSIFGCTDQAVKTPPAESAKLTHQLPQITDQPTSAKDWPMFMSNLQFSGHSIDTNLQPPLRLRWKFKTGGQILASPIVVNNTVYVGSNDGFFYAFEAKIWKIKWTFRGEESIRNAAVFWNNRIFFSTTNNMIYALSAETGDKIWEYKSQSWINTSPVASAGQIYFGGYSDKIYVFNAVTGKLIRSVRRRIQISGTEYACVQGKLAPVSIEHQTNQWRNLVPFSQSLSVSANNVVYIGARDNKIYAIDISSKKQVWTYETNGYVDAAPAISDGMLYVASCDGYIYAFENDTGTQQQVRQKPGRTGTIVSDNRQVYETSRLVQNKLRLNDGVKVSIISREGLHYQIVLPNGETGWVDRTSIGVFDQKDEISFNTIVCSNVETLKLIKGAESPHWSPNGNLIAFLRRKNLAGQYWKASELWITNPISNKSRRLCSGDFYNPNLSWSLDGNFITFEAYHQGESYVWIIDRFAKNLTKLIKGDAPAWSPIANRVAFRRWEEGIDTIYLMNADKTGLKKIVGIPIEGKINTFTYLNPPIWSPNGQNLALGMDREYFKDGYAKVLIYKISGKKSKEFSTQSQRVGQISWSQDTSKIMYVTTGNLKPDPTLDKRIYLTSINLPSQTKTIKHTSPSWSPRGDRVVFMEREDCMGIQWKVWLLELEKNQMVAIARTKKFLTAVEWLPDGDRICLWHTSKYLRGGEYRPATTKGWIVKINW
ncbi:hypothetical protein CMK22_00885 [Candidatus Poribacteria bacterium]|nr:hypothetical protein [Candidatus Poribacteria bacterium]